MRKMKLSSFSVLAFAALGVVAAQESAKVNAGDFLDVQTKFSAIDSQKDVPELINDQETPVEFIFTNKNAPGPIVVAAIGGAFYDKKTPGQIYANLTNTKVGPLTIEPGSQDTLIHNVRVDLPPIDFDLSFTVFVQYSGEFLSLSLKPETVVVNDAPISGWDPRLILVQLIIAVSAAGVGYLLSKRVILPYLETKFPDAAAKTKKEESKSGRASPAVNLNKKGYDESWIPEHHLKSKKKA
jgi:hypothetical protein